MVATVIEGAAQLELSRDGMTHAVHRFEGEEVADDEDAFPGSESGPDRKGELNAGSEADQSEIEGLGRIDVEEFEEFRAGIAKRVIHDFGENEVACSRRRAGDIGCFVECGPLSIGGLDASSDLGGGIEGNGACVESATTVDGITPVDRKISRSRGAGCIRDGERELSTYDSAGVTQGGWLEELLIDPAGPTTEVVLHGEDFGRPSRRAGALGHREVNGELGCL